MARLSRETIAPNTYRDAYGIDTEVRFRGALARERWPLDADRDEMARWVLRAKSELQDRAADAGTTQAAKSSTRGTLAGDIDTFLKTRRGRASYASDKCHLAAWATLLGRRRRSQIKKADVELAMAAWRTQTPRMSDQTIIHRCRVLRVLWRHFDGERARTPVDAAKIPPKPKPHPVRLPVGTIQAVADRLLDRAKTYAEFRMKTYARFLVLSMTAQRPDQMARAKPLDVDMQRGVWMVRSAKGEPSHPVFFNDDIRHAFEVFITWKAWGTYNGSRYRSQLRLAGYPSHISTYNVRHEAAAHALEQGADLGDVQGFLGHTEIQTTRRNYGPLVAARQRSFSEKMGGRLKR